jgi:hypothetical protein
MDVNKYKRWQFKAVSPAGGLYFVHRSRNVACTVYKKDYYSRVSVLFWYFEGPPTIPAQARHHRQRTSQR